MLVSALLACIEQAKQHPETTPKANVVAHNEASSESLPLAAAIQAAKGWDNVYRQLMLAGKHMPVLDEAQRTAENQVEGCEAAVWLGAMATATQSRQFIAYTPSQNGRGPQAGRTQTDPFQGNSCMVVKSQLCRRARNTS